MSLRSKLTALLTSANAVTGEDDTNLTDAVKHLIDGQGSDTYNLLPIAHAVETLTSDATSTSSHPISASFISAISADFSSISEPQSYMYAISYRGAGTTNSCYVASSESFMINMASSESIGITFWSAYHKFWQKTNGAIAQKETQNGGVVVGAGAGANTTITQSAGWWTHNGATAKAGTYDITVFRIREVSE